ncbi:MAG: hypothetical protein M3238_01955 [Actinomycetota bacterium]|nr:hypothetical protein [Actinomycetota bacterium]
MLDRAFRNTFRSYSTLFLLVLVVTLPLHLIYSYAFRNVIATQEIHPQIRQFPNYRQVRSVGPKQLTHATVAFWGLTALELVLLPAFVKATRRVIEIEQDGGVSSVRDGWDAAFRRSEESFQFRRHALPAVVIGGIVAFVLGWLVEQVGLTLAGFGSVDYAWVLVGSVQALARAAAAPFALTAIVMARNAKARPLGTPKLY